MLEGIDMERLPVHIAINGWKWSLQEKGLPQVRDIRQGWKQ